MDFFLTPEQIGDLSTGGIIIIVLWIALQIAKVIFPNMKKENTDSKNDKMDKLIDEVRRLGENHLNHLSQTIVEGNRLSSEQHEKQIEILGRIDGRLSK